MQRFVKDPFQCVLVVATRYNPGVAKGVVDAVQRLSGGKVAHAVYTEDDDVTIALESVKAATGGPNCTEDKRIVLIAQGHVGAAAIRYLCDDYDKPAEERRVVWIHSLAVGIDTYKFGEIPELVADIPITNAKRAQSRALAEYVFSALYYFNRKTWQWQASMDAKEWNKYSIQEMYGQRMGIIGYGDIGEATGKLAAAFGMTVEAVKRSLPHNQADSPYVDHHGVTVYTEDMDRTTAAEKGTEVAEAHRRAFEAHRERIIAESDYIVNVLPGTPETELLFNKAHFKRMKKTALYVNIGRGCTNDEQGLIEALAEGALRGAALDVFQEEPLPPSSPLWAVPQDKLMLTSHIGAQTLHQQPSLVMRFMSLCEKWQRGESLKSEEVNREFWY